MSGHPVYEEEFDEYALGAAKGEECRGFEAHVAVCAECARKLAEARGRVALLALAASPQTPPPAVKQKLLRQVRGSESPVSPKPLPAHRQSPLLGRRFVPLWAAAVVLLALATMYLWRANGRLDQQLAKLRTTTRQQQAQAARAQALLDLLTARDTIEIRLTAPPETLPAQGQVLYNAREGMVMWHGTLPPPPEGKTYQLWLVPPAGNPVSAGIFAPHANGRGSFLFTSLPKGIPAKAFAVTIEPAGGRPQPTGPKVLSGSVS